MKAGASNPKPRPFDDFRAVMDAASALDVREIDFFRLSFRQWFGREPRGADVEPAFADYMFGRAVPPWVRHFSRRVLRLAERNRLDSAALGAMPFKRQPPPHPRGRFYVGMTLAVMVFYCVALLNVGYDPKTSAPLPCGGGPGLKVMSDLAHAIGGRAPPSCALAPDAR